MIECLCLLTWRSRHGCNNNCRHCYINLAYRRLEAQSKELSLTEIRDLADQAVDMGALLVSYHWGRTAGTA